MEKETEALPHTKRKKVDTDEAEWKEKLVEEKEKEDNEGQKRLCCADTIASLSDTNT
jgi:hypothetical protein